MILKIKDHQSPKRTPDTFAENFSKDASDGKLIYHGDSSFSFKYRKSDKFEHSFTGLFFPLENVDIDFSKFDEVEIGINTQKARRVPFNLSVQNKKDTHQYVRQFLEIKKGQKIYSIRLNDFFTPTTWYDRNNVAQVDIPTPDFSKVEALSFESCHLLENNVQDEFEIFQIILKKDKNWIWILIAVFLVGTGAALRMWFNDHFKKEKKIIHVPVKQVEYEKSDAIEDKIIIFLSENYTNPNLTLNDLTNEFGVNSRELSSLIKKKTEMTFPRYINFLRVEEAKRILSSKNYKTVSEVGYAVGFNSPSNFNRVFKSIEGVSPKQYSVN